MDSRDVRARSDVTRRAARGMRRLPRARRWRSAGALLVAVLSTGGCYHYVAVSPRSVAPDEDVRVRVTPAAAERLSQELGVYSTEIDGKLSPRGADSLAVAVPIERQYRGVALDSTVQSLTLARSEVVDVRRSELSRGRTILTSAGVIAGFALLVRSIVQLTNPNPGEDVMLPPPPPAGARGPRGHSIGVRIPIP